MKKILLFSCFSALLLSASCQEGRQQNKQAADTPVTIAPDTARAEGQLLESYTGTVPCADCEGIQTTVEIYSGNNYVLRQVYLGKEETRFRSAGKLNFERGFENDKDATLYILDYDKPGEEQYFVRLTGHDKELTMLDRERKRIVSSANYTLHKQ